MDSFRDGALQYVNGLLDDIPSKIMSINEVLSTNNDVETSEERFRQIFLNHDKNNLQINENTDVVNVSTFARSQGHACIRTLKYIERLILLNVPAIEDGGNFGVSVQTEIYKQMKELREELTKNLDDLNTYHKERADTWDKNGSKVSEEEKTTTQHVEQSGGKAEEAGNKDVTSRINEEKKIIFSLNNDRLAYLAALDSRQYSKAIMVLETICDCYMIALDRMEKNKQRLLHPRGHESSSSLSMY